MKKLLGMIGFDEYRDNHLCDLHLPSFFTPILPLSEIREHPVSTGGGGVPPVLTWDLTWIGCYPGVPRPDLDGGGVPQGTPPPPRLDEGTPGKGHGTNGSIMEWR